MLNNNTFSKKHVCNLLKCDGLADRWTDRQTDGQPDDGEVISMCQPADANHKNTERCQTSFFLSFFPTLKLLEVNCYFYHFHEKSTFQIQSEANTSANTSEGNSVPFQQTFVIIFMTYFMVAIFSQILTPIICYSHQSSKCINVLSLKYKRKHIKHCCFHLPFLTTTLCN